MISEEFNTLYVDPGEDTGWCVACGDRLLSAGTEKLWPFADEVWEAIHGNGSILNHTNYARTGVEGYELDAPLKRIVCEDFRIYPWKAEDLAWDEVRTARLIGALTFMSRVFELEFVLQGADIKKQALNGGAEEFFYRPTKENRHQNDAVMHWWFYVQTELRRPG